MAVVLGCGGDAANQDESIPISTAGRPVSGGGGMQAAVAPSAGAGAGGSSRTSGVRTGAEVMTTAGMGGLPGVAGRAGSGATAGTAGGSAGMLASAAGSGGAAGNSGGAGAAGAPVPDVACDPAADDAPEAMPVSYMNIGEPTTGPNKVIVEYDPGVANSTVYRPENLDAIEAKLPIVVWGNGGCVQDGLTYAEFLSELASHGMLVMSDGSPSNRTNSPTPGMATDEAGVPMIKMIDWAIAENERPCSKYYHKLDTQKVAAHGSSCGTWMSLGAAKHPNMATIILWNGGLFGDEPAVYDSIHTPVMFFVGGETDIATPYAAMNFEGISGGKNMVPLFWASEDRPEWTRAGALAGHIYDFFLDNGGEASIVAMAWFKWHLFGDESKEAKGMFAGADCGLCMNPQWTIMKSNMD